MNEKLLVGVIETIDLPELGLFGIATRIDTGAQTSALHVDHISTNDRDGTVRFEFHPDFHDIKKTIECSAHLHDMRWIKSSNGDKERRYIISTLAILGALEWSIQLSLTNRSSMNHLMLLGRQAMENKLIVDPSNTFIASTA